MARPPSEVRTDRQRRGEFRDPLRDSGPAVLGLAVPPPTPFFAGLIVTCWMLPILTNGRTPGRFSVGIRMRPGRNPLRLGLRWALVWGVYPLGMWLSGYGVNHRDEPTGIAALVLTGVLVLWPLALLAGVHERFSGTDTEPEVSALGTRQPE